jgi:mono/diheme cytochrome c family protein
MPHLTHARTLIGIVTCTVVMWWSLLGMPLAAAQRHPTVSTPYVFVRYCSACHGTHGRGDGPAAPVLQPPPADLTRITRRHDGLFPVAEITAAIDGRAVIPAHGSREMPIWGTRFTEMGGGGPRGEVVLHDVLRTLIDYLQSIQQ